MADKFTLSDQERAPARIEEPARAQTALSARNLSSGRVAESRDHSIGIELEA
jgi:hypothetical protein